MHVDFNISTTKCPSPSLLTLPSLLVKNVDNNEVQKVTFLLLLKEEKKSSRALTSSYISADHTQLLRYPVEVSQIFHLG